MFAMIELLLIPLVLLLGISLGLAVFAFWVWMLVSAIQNKGLTDGEKTGWVLAIALLHFLGALLYYFIGYPKSKVTQSVTGTGP
jgi:prolipoprotein diacylglyceryltransferase